MKSNKCGRPLQSNGVSSVNLSPSFVPTTLLSDLLNLFEEDDVEDLLAPSQEEAEESRLSPDLAYILESLPPPSVSEQVSDFFEFYLLSTTMSDMKADSISVLKKSSDYKVWSSQMLGYLTFIEADEALNTSDLKDRLQEGKHLSQGCHSYVHGQ